MHLAADDVPVFLRSFLNCYAIDILPKEGYVFNEHAVHGLPDKIFEEAAFLERFRNMLVIEDGDSLWLGRALPRAWQEQGKKSLVKNAPTHFGPVGYEIVSDADNGTIMATEEMPSRRPPASVRLRLRHPRALPMKNGTVNGRPWTDFDPAREVVSLAGLSGTVKVVVRYRRARRGRDGRVNHFRRLFVNDGEERRPPCERTRVSIRAGVPGFYGRDAALGFSFSPPF